MSEEAVREIERWMEEARRYAENVEYWRGRAEQAEADRDERLKLQKQAEAQVRALRPIVKLLADLFDDPDARHIVLGWFDEEQIRQALATPPAPTEPTP